MRTADPRYRLALWLARRPCFCCGCWCLARDDARRMKRVLRLVRAIVAAWDDDVPTVRPPVVR